MSIKYRNKIISEHYAENYDILVRRMRFRVGNYSVELAEEVVQEAYTRALKYFKRFNKNRGGFDQWFSTILNNCLNQMKKNERDKGIVYELDLVADPTIGVMPEELMVQPVGDRNRFRTGLHDAISKEGLRDKMILSMFFFDGFKSREIAEFMALNHNNVRQIINRFREKLVAVPVGVA